MLKKIHIKYILMLQKIWSKDIEFVPEHDFYLIP